ncbi:hypothetical protein R1sor_012419 [Riccia sorocarpa]|uniref:RimM N-terminal domain-containing protein n=1 Tax=Riccia sorocarpa TaxID=122646 RepID=A0ABD3I3Q9_9MARC
MALQSTCVCVHGRLLHGVLAAAAELYSEGSGLGVLKASILFFSGSDSAAESTCSATAVLESGVKDSGSFVEVGYIANTHGVHGELHVYSLTDFPEELFQKPGKRWVRSKHMGRPVYQEVELLEGREVGGKRPSCLITLKGYNSVENLKFLTPDSYYNSNGRGCNRPLGK